MKKVLRKRAKDEKLRLMLGFKKASFLVETLSYKGFSLFF